MTPHPIHHSYFDLPTDVHTSPTQSAQHNMPSISESEPLQDSDEPADPALLTPQFSKTIPTQVRRNSMLTKALHTDSESHDSHDESLGFSSFRRQPSRSSTCSTWSARSGFTSEDGRTSLSSSPSRPVMFRKDDYVAEPVDLRRKASSPANASSPTVESISPEKTAPPSSSADQPVEEKLGRRRCISFACGAQKNPDNATAKTQFKAPERSTTDPVSTAETQQSKRPCMIKFACPSKISFSGLNKEKAADAAAKASRRPSPPPLSRVKSLSPAPIRVRIHRDSDSTIKEESPKTARTIPPLEPRRSYMDEPEPETSQGPSFSAFASKEEKVDEWTEENTCHKSRLTVDDTLIKEKDLQQLGEEAEEEAREEEDLNDLVDLDSDDDPVSEGGFDTDDEEGFAESDDDSDGNSDYEWWAPRKSPSQFKLARLAPGDDIRPPALHADVDESYESSVSPKKSRGVSSEVTPRRKLPRHNVAPVSIRAPTPELPDSTDFVCGTLDEDKPLEEAYASVIQQRKAARRTVRPQDIDPTFPTDIASDDDDAAAHEDSDQAHFMHGAIENIDAVDDGSDDEARGRTSHARGRSPRPSPPPVKSKRSPPQVKHSPAPAAIGIMSIQRHKSPMPPPSHAALQRRPKSPAPPKRAKSPAPTVKRAKSPIPSRKPSVKQGQQLRSPPPRSLFGHSPRRSRALPSIRTVSPAPSRRGSPPTFMPAALGTGFLGHRPSLTHTSSLPRSPNLFAKKRTPFEAMMTDSEVKSDDDHDDGEDTAKENRVYERGAIDIVQGLERKRLRRRQVFYERYCRKEEKKAQRREKQLDQSKRPQPGTGAQRMRQVGIECAIYRGKRILSI